MLTPLHPTPQASRRARAAAWAAAAPEAAAPRERASKVRESVDVCDCVRVCVWLGRGFWG